MYTCASLCITYRSIYVLYVKCWSRSSTNMYVSNIFTKQVTAAVANFYVPTISMLYIYGRIFCTIRQRSRNHLGEVSFSKQQQQSAPVPSNQQVSPNNVGNHHQRTVDDFAGKSTNAVSTNDDCLVDPAAVHSDRPRQLCGDDDDDPPETACNHKKSRPVRSWFPHRRNYHLRCERKRSSRSKSAVQSTMRNADNNHHSYDVYNSITLLQIHDVKPSKLSCSSHISHFANVQVQVTYDDEESSPVEDQVLDADVENVVITTAAQVGARVTRTNKSRSSVNASNLISRKERKAARQLGVTMFAFIFCWLPYFIVFLVVAICPTCIGDTLYNVTLWLGYVNSTLNPVLYPLCNANFRRAFSKTLSKTCRLPFARDTKCPVTNQ